MSKTIPFALLLTSVACNPNATTDILQTGQTVAVVPSAPIEKLDLLFVVDNSGSMHEEQEKLADSTSDFIARLASTSFGLPDLHIALTTTTVDTGNFGIMGCPPSVGGEFRSPSCAGATDSFLQDSPTDEGRSRNYQGELKDALSCMIEVGTDGCGFEQPLEAVKRALNGSNPGNAGFIRDDAMLAIVIVSDEDDCSAKDTSIFNSDPNLNQQNSPLGFLTSFRCFEFGVLCDEDEIRSDGEKSNCQPRENSQYIQSIQHYVDFLVNLKGSARDVVAFSLSGPSNGKVEVIRDSEKRQQIAESCSSSAGAGFPAIRLAAFSDALNLSGFDTSICDSDFSPIADLLGNQLSNSLDASPCLQGKVVSQDRCFAEEVQGYGTEAETRSRMLRCEDTGPGRCYDIVEDLELCPDSDSHLALRVESNGNPTPLGTDTLVTCAVEEQ